MKDAVAVIPMDLNGNVYLVRQYRHAIQKTLIEVPAGLVEEDENPDETEIRECEEEIGYHPGQLKKLLYYAHSEGYSTGFTTLFWGTNLQYTGKFYHDSSEYLEQIIMRYDELLNQIRKIKSLNQRRSFALG